MQKHSFWLTNQFQKKPTSIAIIGGGITGLLSAIYAAKAFRSKQIILIEKQPNEAIASTRNAGFHCLGSPSEIWHDLQTFGAEVTHQNLKKRIIGMDALLKLFGKNAISYRSCYGFDVDFEKESYENIRNVLPLLNQMAEDASNKKNKFFGIISSKMLTDNGLEQFSNGFFTQPEGQLNPLELILNAQKLATNLGVKIVKGITVENIASKEDYCQIETQQFDFQAEKVIVATNALTSKLLPSIAIKPGRGMMLASKPIRKLKLRANVHADAGFLYFRNFEDRILLGGYRNLDFDTEQTYYEGENKIIKDALITYGFKNLGIPTNHWEQSWSGIMAFTENKTPIIEKISDRLIVVAGLNGMGMAIAPILAKEVVNMLTTKEKKP